MVEDKDPVNDGNSSEGECVEYAVDECVEYAVDAAVDVILFVDLADAVVVYD